VNEMNRNHFPITELFTIGRARRILLELCFVATLFAFCADALPQVPGGPLTFFGKYKNEFTTQAYQRAALELLLREANQVARELNLPEKLPIMESNVVGGFICPFGFAYNEQSIGRITTRNYDYGVTKRNKFSRLVIANYQKTCVEYENQYVLPIEQLDTNGAYQLGIQWLAAARMDVKGLNRDCQVHVELSPYWNGIRQGEKLQTKTFVPIYVVYWTGPADEMEEEMGMKADPKADIELLAPTRMLLQFSVYDPKYILRQPLVFTNLAVLIGEENLPSRRMTNMSVRQSRWPIHPTNSLLTNSSGFEQSSP